MTNNMRNRLFRPKYGKVEAGFKLPANNSRIVSLPTLKKHAARLPMKKTVPVQLRPGEATLTAQQKKIKKVTRDMAKKGAEQPLRERMALTQKAEYLSDDSEPLLNWSKLNSAKEAHSRPLDRL